LSADDCFFYFKELACNKENKNEDKSDKKEDKCGKKEDKCDKKENRCNKKEDKCEKKCDEGCTAVHSDLKIRKAKFCNPPTFVVNSYYELKSVVESRCKCCNDVWYTATLLQDFYLNEGSIQSVYPCDEACKEKVIGIRGRKVDVSTDPPTVTDVLFVDVCKDRKCNSKCNVYYGVHYLRLGTETVCNITVDYGMIICYTKSCERRNSIIFPVEE